MSDILRARKGVDTVLTEYVYAAFQGESLLPFIAPTVQVASRSGKIITFDKSQFAVVSTKRDPYANHKSGRVSGYDTNRAYVLEQHTRRAEISWEEVEEAEAGGLNIDLRELAVLDATAKIEQSLEQELYNLITNPANYEAGNAIVATGTDQFSNSGSDPEAFVWEIKSLTMDKIGRYATRAVISDDVYRALALNPIFRDKSKYTSNQTNTLDVIAAWLGFEGGIEVANRRKLDPATGNVVNMFPNGTMLAFVDARDARQYRGASNDSPVLFKPTPMLTQATATFAQLYTYGNGLTVGVEDINEDNDTYSRIVRFTGSPVLPSVGDNGLSAAGVLITNLI